MATLQGTYRSWLVCMGIMLCAAMPPVAAAPLSPAASISEPAAFLDNVESLRTKDHPQFLKLLAQVHAERPVMDRASQWHLRYLDTWELQFEGNYPKAEEQLHDIMDHSGDQDLAARAASLLLNNYIATGRFEQGYSLANRLATGLDAVRNPLTRFNLLANLSILMNFAGQIDLAVNYSQLMESSVPPGETLCYPKYLRVAALQNGKQITSADPAVREAIATCTAARQAVLTNATSLVLGDLYLAEGKPELALSALERLDPAIRASGYHVQMVSAMAQRAQALEALGRDDEALKIALQAIALGGPDESSEWLMYSYGVAYRVEKKRGNTGPALSYYEQFVKQSMADRHDLAARVTAYELTHQRTLVHQLETESLGRQNRILRLQQALGIKAIETGRLYIALLLAAMASVAIWAYRTKRSQLRFEKLAHRDGLTGIYHHQHFMVEAERCLRALEKRSAGACLLSIDMDHFKQVNDTHGHATGDAVLRHAVAVCQQALRADDIFGRLGGEEFGILLVDCSRAEGAVIADRIRFAIEASPLMEDGTTVALSASMGLACTGLSGYSLKQLCRDSDAALYRAKRSGRNRVVAHADLDDQATGGMPGSNLSNVTG